MRRATLLMIAWLAGAGSIPARAADPARIDRTGQVLRLRVLPLTSQRSRREVRPGDTVRVTDRRARLMRETTVIAPLTAGELIYVTQLEGAWIGGHVVLDGKVQRGWVLDRQVAFHAEELRLEAVPQLDPAAPFVSAAMLLEKARRFDLGVLSALADAARRKQIPPGPLTEWAARATVAETGWGHAPFDRELDQFLRCEVLRFAPDDGRMPDAVAELAAYGREQAFDWPLEPRSGWPAYHAWSLAPLLSPRGAAECVRAAGDETWSAHLASLARGQVSLPPVPSAKRIVEVFPQDYPPAPFPDEDDVLIVRPVLSVEPLPTVYYRRALGYRWLRASLEPLPEREAAGLQRQIDGDDARESLIAELRRMETLFLGASRISAGELGLADFPPQATDEHAAAFRQWAARLADDPDLGRDCREMIALDPQSNGRVRVRAMLGWAARTLEVSYARPPAVTFPDRPGPILRPQFGTREFSLWEPVWVELELRRGLDAAEFRTLCDAYRTRLAIEAACVRIAGQRTPSPSGRGPG